MFKQRTGDASVEVSDDGKLVICRNADGGIRWQHPYPPSLAWRRFIKGNYGDAEHGIFLFAGFEAEATVCAVFRPAHGLDFNIRYNANTGEITDIYEAR